MYNHISDGDKERLLFDPETGRWSGYKHPYGFKRRRGLPDGIEQFNWYPREWKDRNRIPTCLHPFMDEIEAFCNVSFKFFLRETRTLLCLPRHPMLITN